ncbi:MAG: hypothetical protein HY553_03490 [Elusimicrobia bacterium]|nr:hypothetical protein [Elusimicrobiota bacterium]
MSAPVLDRAVAVLRLARRLGIEDERVLVEAPVASALCGRRVLYFRGWRLFDGCVKAFNALGLLAEPGTSDAALRAAYARRRIVCSTSANMGISLHQALRRLREIGVLGPREGELLIWCPDARADFMSAEKAAALRRLAAERPRLTTLRTYLNRRQRDPGALRDALRSGGWFFPTNPQSREELARLSAEAAEGLGRRPPAARKALDGGLLGMGAAYALLLEAWLARGERDGFSLWNPASIGAALAGLALADAEFRTGERPAGLSAFAPRLAAARRLPPLRLHGVFDIANLQSLAQLFGVVVTRHYSGRRTAYVGLGSSSYATGNLCFETLAESARKGGAFAGRDALHPATHTLNPVAQALVFAEGLPKPEPAGAAGLAGYLLSRLDAGTLTAARIGRALTRAGFDEASFGAFMGQDAGRWAREAGEEGPAMEAFARDIRAALRARPRPEAPSRRAGDAVVIHLTGDQTAQPKRDIARAMRG